MQDRSVLFLIDELNGYLINFLLLIRLLHGSKIHFFNSYSSGFYTGYKFFNLAVLLKIRLFELLKNYYNLYFLLTGHSFSFS